MDDNTLNTEQVSKIETLADYIREITSLRERLLDEGRSELLFFRGQSNVSWDVRPSVFRDSLISVENEIIQKAISRVPFEFNNCSNSFEVLTKLQHYGLPTRLLDVTMNPLVALYFSCSSSISINEGEESDGIIYYSSAYGEHEKSSKVQMLSSLAQIDFNGDTTLLKLKQILKIQDDITPESFIKAIQNNLFVTSNYSNDRIIRQSGAFMLSGAITISEDIDNIWNSKIQKSICSLNSEFNNDHIIISSEAKEHILDELDFCNINESTLFPELEHQMSHIKRIGTKSVATSIPEFIHYESQINTNIYENRNRDESSLDEDIIKTIIYKSIDNADISRQISQVIDQLTIFTDWHKKETIQYSLISAIKRVLVESGVDNAKEIARQIVHELVISVK